MATLIDVQKNFNMWRATRQNRKEKIPATLWQQVASIYSAYPRSVICQTLGLSGTQLKVAMQGDGFATFYPSVKKDGISTVKDHTDIPISVCEIALETPSARLIVKVSTNDFSNVLSELMRYMPC
jgi:hypothetical protein